MISFDDVTKKKKKKPIKQDNPKWQQFPDHPYRIIIIGGSGSGYTNSFFNSTVRY